MKSKLLVWLIEMLMGMFSPKLLKDFADMVLDFVEDAVTKSETDIDDKIVLPLCNMIRTAFDIPDDD